MQNLMNHGSASSSSSGQTLSAISAGDIQVRNAPPGSLATAQTIAGLEANARADTNTQANAPDVAAVQKRAVNQQTGNQLLFNVGSWATDQGALKNALAAVQSVNSCTISSGGKDCGTTRLHSGDYAISNNTSVYLGINGIMNKATAAGDNIGDMATLFTTPDSANNTLVLNVYSPGVSGLGSLIAGGWNAVNANVFHGALGIPAGAQLEANLAGQISQANQQGSDINVTLLAHSDGTAQTVIGMEQNPNAFAGVSVNHTLPVILAEPSANAATAQSKLNKLGVSAGVFYSAAPTDPVPTLAILGNNPPTEQTSQGYFTVGPLYYGNDGLGVTWSGLKGTSVHSDPGYSAMVIPAATRNGQTGYTWGFSGNSKVPGKVPSFRPAIGTPTDAKQPKADIKDGGKRTFGVFTSAKPEGTTIISISPLSITGSTARVPHIAPLVWTGGGTANLDAALPALNGLPNKVALPPGTSIFAPGSTGTAAATALGGSTQSPNKPVTPAQRRCLVLTGGSLRCLQ